MKFESNWQPVRNEDAQTALVFGFLRHAGDRGPLDSWLSDMLERPVVAEPIEPTSFWPRYESEDTDQHHTEPDVVLQADDGRPLVVIIEAKPDFGQHVAAQLAREAVDVARGEAAARIAVVPVGADLGAPADVTAWREAVEQRLQEAGLGHVEVELRYSSWARLARAIDEHAQRSGAWRTYANDVLTRLRAKGVLGYEGAPVIDDLEGLTLPNAIEAFNRTIRAFRQLALTVHGQSAIGDLGLKPYHGGHALLRDGRTTALPSYPEAFEMSVLLVAYEAADFPAGCGVFFSGWLGDPKGLYLQVGAFHTTAGRGDLPWGMAGAELKDELQSAALTRTPTAVLDTAAASRHTEWVYSERAWTAEAADADLEWILAGLRAASELREAPRA